MTVAPFGVEVTSNTPSLFASGTYKLLDSGTVKIRRATVYPFAWAVNVWRPFASERVQGAVHVSSARSSTTTFAPGGSVSSSTEATPGPESVSCEAASRGEGASGAAAFGFSITAGKAGFGSAGSGVIGASLS